MTNYLQITGKAYIEQPLKKDKAYTVTLKEITVYGADERSGNGDEDTVTYKAKVTADILIQNETEIITGQPKKGSMSQLLRRVIMDNFENQEAGNYQDFEAYYQKRMSELIEAEKNLYI